MATSAVGKNDRTIGTRGDAQEQEQGDQYRWIILLGLITAAIMEVLDTTIINVALPQMAGNLGATIQEIAWVSTGYILSNVVVLPMTAFFTATFGRKNYLTGSIILFVTASFLCGTSHSLGELILWRVVQGAGGAALLSTAQATLRQIFPREEQGMVQAIFILGIIVAPTLGPTLGGWITDNYNWGWCFFINVPIGIVATFLVTGFLHDPPGMRKKPQSIDWAGISLLTIGLASLQYVLEEGREKDWFNDTLIIRLSIVAGVSLAGMLWWELSPRNKHPVIDFHVLKNRDLAGSIFLFIALGFGLYGGVFLFPLFTQNLLHFTPTETGLTLMPGGIATAVRGDRVRTSAQRRQAAGRRPNSDLHRHVAVRRRDVAAGASDRGRRRARSAIRADHSWARLGLSLHADQQRGLREPQAEPGTAGIRADQPGAPTGRLVRDRDHHDVSGSSGRHAPGDADGEHVYREPAARRASERGGRRAHREGLQRHPGEAGRVWRSSTRP